MSAIRFGSPNVACVVEDGKSPYSPMAYGPSILRAKRSGLQPDSNIREPKHNPAQDLADNTRQPVEEEAGLHNTHTPAQLPHR